MHNQLVTIFLQCLLLKGPCIGVQRTRVFGKLDTHLRRKAFCRTIIFEVYSTPVPRGAVTSDGYTVIMTEKVICRARSILTLLVQ